ncbi:hypothetical protein L1267_16790 [Pseudoalteromonas sp. OFAV1]|uniref:hypothetical protein n=1 Tax=Pseudoalteromonas sp. OFAV1 TaxID=2908892 RepID=UPI001F3399B1|nr:hypothetical protein [Pseudoalteromonas sp. OFAV1]MCF2902034.1 hypothetical protein [Pseudoalteromonas sp. OFAV1]
MPEQHYISLTGASIADSFKDSELNPKHISPKEPIPLLERFVLKKLELPNPSVVFETIESQEECRLPSKIILCKSYREMLKPFLWRLNAMRKKCRDNINLEFKGILRTIEDSRVLDFDTTVVSNNDLKEISPKKYYLKSSEKLNTITVLLASSLRELDSRDSLLNLRDCYFALFQAALDCSKVEFDYVQIYRLASESSHKSFFLEYVYQFSQLHNKFNIRMLALIIDVFEESELISSVRFINFMKKTIHDTSDHSLYEKCFITNHGESVDTCIDVIIDKLPKSYFGEFLSELHKVPGSKEKDSILSYIFSNTVKYGDLYLTVCLSGDTLSNEFKKWFIEKMDSYLLESEDGTHSPIMLFDLIKFKMRDNAMIFKELIDRSKFGDTELIECLTVGHTTFINQLHEYQPRVMESFIKGKWHTLLNKEMSIESKRIMFGLLDKFCSQYEDLDLIKIGAEGTKDALSILIEYVDNNGIPFMSPKKIKTVKEIKVTVQLFQLTPLHLMRDIDDRRLKNTLLKMISK